jgi:hypothetical protein
MLCTQTFIKEVVVGLFHSAVEESGVLSGLITRGSVVQIHPALFF